MSCEKTEGSMDVEGKNYETYFLVWLDNSKKIGLNPQHIEELRGSIHYLRQFSDEIECETYIQTLTKEDKVILIVHAQQAKEFIPRIHHLPQITSVYVFCINKSKYQAWANEHKKIKCLINQYDELIAQIGHDQKRRHQAKVDEILSISIVDENSRLKYNNSQEPASSMNYDFAFSYLLVNCLMKMKFFYTDRREFTKLCQEIYKENSNELSLVDEFIRTYCCAKSLFWLTKDSFVQRLIAKALRRKNFQILFLCRFIFQDVYQELQSHKCLKPVRVYRSSYLSANQLNLLQNSIGKIISINSFFITNLNRKQSTAYLKEIVCSNDHHVVLFEIDADPRLNGILPFANITSLSASPGTQIILFMSGSLFRIMNIQNDNNSCVIIQMKLCSPQEEDLNMFKFPDPFDFISFGQMLIDKRKFDEAQIYYHHLLHDMTDDHPDIAVCYDALGQLFSDKYQFSSSLKWYEKSLAIKAKRLEHCDPLIASAHNSIALLYLNKLDYPKALESYQQALHIYQQKFGEDHTRVAECLNNMAAVQKNQKRYRDALNLYHKSLSIYEKHSADNQLNIAMSYNNIGLIHRYLAEYDLALENFNRALKIYESILPWKHILISMTLENIANSHSDKEDLNQALAHYESAADIYQQLLPPTHPDVIQIRMTIKRIALKFP